MIGGVVEEATRKGEVSCSNSTGHEARNFTRKKNDLRLRRASLFPQAKRFVNPRLFPQTNSTGGSSIRLYKQRTKGV